jgi:hypothetical protein
MTAGARWILAVAILISGCSAGSPAADVGRHAGAKVNANGLAKVLGWSVPKRPRRAPVHDRGLVSTVSRGSVRSSTLSDRRQPRPSDHGRHSPLARARFAQPMGAGRDPRCRELPVPSIVEISLDPTSCWTEVYQVGINGLNLAFVAGHDPKTKVAVLAVLVQGRFHPCALPDHPVGRAILTRLIGERACVTSPSRQRYVFNLYRHRFYETPHELAICHGHSPSR